MGELVRPQVELTVGQRLLSAEHRCGVRSSGGLVLEQLVHSGVVGIRRRRVIPLDDELSVLLRSEEADPAQRQIRVRRDLGEQSVETGRDPLCGIRSEQIEGIAQPSADADGGSVLRVLLEEFKGEIELGNVGVTQTHLRGQARKVQPGGGVVLHGQQHLEEGVLGSGALRVELVHHVLEGDVLVGEGLQGHLSYPSQQLPEGGIAGGVGPDHQGVHEESDQVAHRLVSPVGNGGAHRNVVPRAQPGEQCGEGSLHHHEQTGPMGAAQTDQALVQLCVQLEEDRVAAIAGRLRPGVVEGQIELVRDAVQGPGPEGQLLTHQGVGVRFRTEDLTLPQRVVRVLHRQHRPRRLRPCAPCRIGKADVTGQRSQRPSVGGDVMHEQEQDVLGLRQGEQPEPDRRVHRQVEAFPGESRDLRGQGGLVGLHHLEVLHRPSRRQDLLERHPLGILGKDGTEALMPVHHVFERSLQRGPVQLPGQTHGEGKVVGGARLFELVEEPQPVLGRGQRDPLRACHRGQRGPGRTRLRDPVGEGGDRGRLEQGPHRHLGPQHRTYPAGQPGGQEGVPPQLEEVVVDTDRRHAQNIREQRTQDLLPQGPRTTPRPGRRQLGSRQRPPVQLPVGGQRKPVQHHEHRGHHVLRQQPGRLHPQRPDIHPAAMARLRDHIGHQTLVTRLVLPSDDHDL